MKVRSLLSLGAVIALMCACASEGTTSAGGPPSGSLAQENRAPPSGTPLASPPPADTLPLKRLDGDTDLPIDTLEDWVTYGDYVLAGTVTSDSTYVRTTPLPEDEVVTADRLADFGRIEVLYQRPGAPALPEPLRLLVAGSMRITGEWFRYVSTGKPRIEVGGRYLITTAYRTTLTDVGDGKVQILSAMPAEDGVAGEGEWAGRTDSEPLLTAQRQILGMNTADIKQLLADTPPDPLAVPYFDLPLDERLEKVFEER